MNKLKTAVIGLGMAGAALPAGSAWASSFLPMRHSAVTGTFRGPSVGMQWGNVQVTIIVKTGKIVKVKATAPHHTSRSSLINSVALPILRSEVLKAQSANINVVSGATLTSNAYIQSLGAALKKAGM